MVEWQLDRFKSANMPAQCWLNGLVIGSCGRVTLAPPGSYIATITGYAACEQGGQACVCDAAENCNGHVVGDITAASATFSLPTSNITHVHFNP